MTSARPLSEPPGLARDSSLTTPSSVLVELMARTLARETEAVPWSARASLTQPLTSRLASWLGVLDVAKTTHQVSRFCVQGCLLDRLRHDLSVWPAERLLLQLLGLLCSAVPDLDEWR